MRQTAQVIRSVSPGYVEVKVRRASACASAHNCGSCDHCSMMENAPEVVVVAQDPKGAEVGDTVTVESDTSTVLGAALALYIVPIILFFVGYFLGGGPLGMTESGAIGVGGIGFLLGLAGALGLDRWWKKHDPMKYKIVAIEG